MIYRVEWTVTAEIEAESEQAAFEIASEMDPSQADSNGLFRLIPVKEGE